MILITGATGIVGTRLAFDLIGKGRSVRGMMRKNSDVDFVKKAFEFYDPEKGNELFDRIEWVIGDVLDIESIERSLEGIREIYHTAALVSYQKKHRKALMAINVEGTSNLINLCIDSSISKFCHISSVAALGSANYDGVTDEKGKWNKKEIRSNYSLSKYLSELEVWRGSGEGLNTVIVNPSLIFGPAKENQSSGSLMSVLRKGVKYYPTGTTGFVDVRDVSRISIELMEKSVFDERFILNSENLTYKALLEIAASIYDQSAPEWQVSSTLLNGLKYLDSIKSLITKSPPKITSESVRSASSIRKFSNQKIRSELDYSFIPVEESLSYYSAFRD